MGKYKHGKQILGITFQEFQSKVSKAKLTLEEEAYMWLLYYCGVRKSEAYERLTSDVTVTEEYFTIDFQQRKKRGEKVPALALHLGWPGINKLVELYKRSKERKTTKNVFYYEMKQRKSNLLKASYLFPNIQSNSAWKIVKKTLGENFYPHYLRLNRVTELGSMEGASMTMIKSFTGIKSIKAMEAYMGISRRAQDKALNYMDTLIPQKKMKMTKK